MKYDKRYVRYTNFHVLVAIILLSYATRIT
jgi:hypothetical protein